MTSIRLFRPSVLRLGVTLTLCALWMTCIHQYPSWRERGGDWVSVVIAARLVQYGHTEALYARRPDHLLVHHPLWQKQAQALDYERNLYPFLYPPVIASAFIPLARVDLAQVKPVILQAELALLVAMIGLACWHWRPTMLRPLPMALLLLSLAFSDPLLAVIRSLNIHPLVLACTIVAMIAAQRNAPILAGSALGLAALVVLLGVLRRDADDGADAIQLALQISGWRSPTDFLLRSMGSEYLTTIPRIGEVTQWYPLDGGVRRAMAAPDRKGSDSL